MALSDLLPKAPPPPTTKAAAIVDRLLTERTTTAAALDAARTAYANALVDHAEGIQDDTAVYKLKKTLDAAQDKANASAAALLMAQTRHRAAMAAEKTLERTNQWDRAIALADERNQALATLDAQAKAFADAWAHVLKLNNDLFEALPDKPDMDAAVLNVPQIETAIRRELLRQGVDWAISYAWGRDTLPPFMDTFKDAPDVIRSWRDQNTGV